MKRMGFPRPNCYEYSKRLDQNDVPRLLADFAWAGDIFIRGEAQSSYNVSPGTYRPVLHVDGDALFVDDMRWGYRSSWAEASGKIPVAINARLENIRNRYWSGLLKRGRAIVPAAGWYEWTGEKCSKQPWHVHRGHRGRLGSRCGDDDGVLHRAVRLERAHDVGRPRCRQRQKSGPAAGGALIDPAPH